jgi:hypothetical protein
MRSCHLVLLGIVLAEMILAGIVPVPSQAQELSRLGLSAQPDAYVSVLETEIDQPFTLYLIATGPGGISPLPFDLYEVDWRVFTACCGDSPVLITGFQYPANTVQEGDPYENMKSTAIHCLDADVVLLATFTFEWSDEFAGLTEFPLSAGTASPAEDCEGGYHVLMGLYVTIVGVPAETAGQTDSWSDLKTLYRD